MKQIIFLIILSCCLCQCLEPFEFDIEDADVEKVLVVDGVLSNSSGPHTVTLSRTQAFGNKFIDPVLGARISLNNQYNFVEAGNGEYVLDNFTAQTGFDYSIQITLTDGSAYESRVAQMPQSVKPDSTFVRYEQDIVTSLTGNERISKVINVYLDTPLPNRENGQDYYLRWITEGLSVFPEESCGGLHMPKTCYVPDPPNAQNLILQSSENISGNRLMNQLVAQKSKYTNAEFKALYVFSTYQYSLTRESFEYWSDLKSIANQSGTVFDLPPAALQGNVMNQNDPTELVLGYFDVAAIDTVRARIIASEFRENINGVLTCSQFSRFSWPSECCQCLVLEGAGTVRPAWLN